MVVRTQKNGTDIPGLRVGASNARRYFPKSMGTVELRLDDLRIQCALPRSFWAGKPEIYDPRLGEWLKFKVLQDCRQADSVALHLVHCGANTFALQPPPSLPKRALRQVSAA
ncbi:MAG TPA: hypothetical protein VHA37_07880 [Candidatus Saccharimonadales bacterium]|nr:hypothetical protein [Candidatus Saccharimonadales bacterium]